MKRVLFFSHNFNRDEAQILLQNIVIGLDKNLFKKQVWGPAEGELVNGYIDNGVPVHIYDFEVDRINRVQFIDFDNETINKINALIQDCAENEKRLGIICAGTITKKLLNEFDFSEVNLIGIFDNDPSLFGREINGVKIFPVKEITKHNLDTVLISHIKPQIIIEELKDIDAEIIDDYFILQENRVSKSFFSYLLNLRNPLFYFMKMNPKIIFVNNELNFWAVIVGKILGKKVIWNIHENFDPKTLEVFPQSLYLWSLKLADTYIFPSLAVYENFKEFVPEQKARIIHCGVEYEGIKKYKTINSAVFTKKKMRIPDNHKVVSTVGIVDKEKGFEYFVKAAVNILKNSEEKNITFIIVGTSDNKYSKYIESLVLESGFKQNFKLIPKSRAVYKYFNIADVYVSSSLNGQLPQVILEAMAFGKPVIAPDIAGIAEIIDHEEDGILIPVNELEAHLENSILRLLEDGNLREKLGKNAHSKLADNFTSDRMLNKYSRAIQY